MNADWVERPLDDILWGKHGYAFPGAGFRDDLPHPTLVTPGNFRIGGGFQGAKTKTFEGDYPDEFRLKPGDVIVTMTDLSRNADTLGYAAVVPDDGRTYLHNQRIGKVVLKSDEADARFVSYLLRTRSYREFIVGGSSGSTVRHTSPKRIEAFSARLPPRPEQRRIASVLGAIDELIEVEQRNAERCDDLWRAYLREKMSSPIELPLSSLATFVNGKNFTKNATGSGLPVIRTPEVRTGPSSSTVHNDLDVDEDNVAAPGDILFVWSGSLLVGRWLWQRGLINQHIFKVIPNHGTPDWLAMWAVEELMDNFLGVAADKATTMGHIKRSDLDRQVALPETPRWAALDSLIRPLWDEALQARMQAADLNRTREELLPLLMSGRVRVDDVEGA